MCKNAPVQPTERERRIVARNTRRRSVAESNQAAYRVALDAFLDEVEAAKNDPRHPMSYAESARLVGMSEQNLQRLRDDRRRRDAGEAPTLPVGESIASRIDGEVDRLLAARQQTG